MEPTCQLAGCGKVESAHRTVAHAFQPREDALKHVRSISAQPVVAADAVLRLTLVAKGIITYDELTETEKLIKAAGLLGGNGEPHRGGDRKVRDNPQA